jgi:predicted nucleic acid-binding protein
VIYADSSVIVKRYYDEPGSEKVREQWTASDRVFTSRVAYAEVHAALARKRRDGGLSPSLFRTSAAAFDTEWPAYDQILVDADTLGPVRRLVRRHALRGYDAIHLAAALWVAKQIGDPLEFWVSDAQLETAARHERLAVVNPERET